MRYADVAQLVEHHLAKVRVAGSNPVVRSEEVLGTRGLPRWSGREARQRTANPSTRVQIPSPPHPAGRLAQWLARFLDTEEVTGSIPVSPTMTEPPPRGLFVYPHHGPPGPAVVGVLDEQPVSQMGQNPT